MRYGGVSARASKEGRKEGRGIARARARADARALGEDERVGRFSGLGGGVNMSGYTVAGGDWEGEGIGEMSRAGSCVASRL